MWHHRVVVAVALAGLISTAGCDREGAAQRPAGKVDSSGELASSASASRTASPDSSGNGLIKQTVYALTADVNKISVASAAEQKKLLPAHITAVNDMLDRFETKVRAMHMKVDPDWVAVIDSVKSDVARMPEMTTDQLHSFLPAHNKRVMRIVACVDMARL